MPRYLLRHLRGIRSWVTSHETACRPDPAADIPSVLSVPGVTDRHRDNGGDGEQKGEKKEVHG
jgi:hypothetical protein